MKSLLAALALCTIIATTPGQASHQPGCHGVAPQQQTCTFSFTAAKDVRDFVLRAPATAGAIVAVIRINGSPQVCTQLDERACSGVFGRADAGARIEGTVVAPGAGAFSIVFRYIN